LKQKHIKEQKKEKEFQKSFEKLPVYIKIDEINKKKVEKNIDKR